MYVEKEKYIRFSIRTLLHMVSSNSFLKLVFAFYRLQISSKPLFKILIFLVSGNSINAKNKFVILQSFYFIFKLLQFCDVPTLVIIHPQAELAKFGYRSKRKVGKKFK
jgi:hypothetical protein